MRRAKESLCDATSLDKGRIKGDLHELSCGVVQDTLTALPETPAARRLAEITSLTREATPTGVIDYLQTHFTSENANHVPLARRIGSFMDWKARGGMDVVEVTVSEAHRIETVVRQPFTDERRLLGVQVEPEPPHRIDSLLMGRSPLPIIEPALDEQAAANSFIKYTGHLAGMGLFSGAVLIARHGRILRRRPRGWLTEISTWRTTLRLASTQAPSTSPGLRLLSPSWSRRANCPSRIHYRSTSPIPTRNPPQRSASSTCSPTLRAWAATSTMNSIAPARTPA